MSLGTPYIPDMVPVVIRGRIANVTVDEFKTILGDGNYITPTADFTVSYNGTIIQGKKDVPIPADIDLLNFLQDGGCPIDYTADLPVITGPGGDTDETSNVTVNEGTELVHDFAASKPVVWTISGDDQALFEITADGVLSFKDAPDYETPLDADEDNIYEVDVCCQDSFGNIVTQSVFITVADVVE